jgi:16S rRNA (cytosine1402-N4)-methyltransferase
MYHQPVMLQECISGINIHSDGIYVDTTFGGGSHSREILKHLTTGKLIAFDQDEDAAANKIDDPNFILIKQNFAFLKNFLKFYKINQVDGILADLGISSHQIDEGSRGFSFRFDAPLDMRMNQNSEKTAADIINKYSEEELADVFYKYGELRNSKIIAKKIISERNKNKIKTTFQLKNTVASLISLKNENKILAMIFQALRIEVNQELDALEKLLQQSLEVLNSGGRLVVMSYHSLEDRMVKNFMKSGNFEGEVKKDFFGNIETPFSLITKKAVIASEDEIKQNNRARSAKLRIAEKK